MRYTPRAGLSVCPVSPLTRQQKTIQTLRRDYQHQQHGSLTSGTVLRSQGQTSSFSATDLISFTFLLDIGFSVSVPLGRIKTLSLSLFSCPMIR